MEAARRFLQELPSSGTVIAADRDVDGLSAAVLTRRALESLGRTAVIVVARRGEHVHAEGMRARLRALAPAALVVVDMGSRGEPILPGVATLVVDHHQPRGLPPGAVVVTAFGRPPVAPTSLLAFHVLRQIADVDDLAWLALLGTVADASVTAPFPVLAAWLERYGRRDTTEAVALLNAARRAADDAVAVARDVLEQARSPRDVARGGGPGVATLRAARRAVHAEVQRCARIAPRVTNGVALVRFASPMQVHPLVAARWSARLHGLVVIAANDGYLPGRVNFAMRTTADVNLVDLLRGIDLGAVDGEYGFGHPGATGGSLPPSDFERLLRALGGPIAIAAVTARAS
jgi:hypothetical protein